MELPVDAQHGTTPLIAGLLIILALHLVLKVGELFFEAFKKKSEETDQTKVDVIRLDYKLKEIQEKLEDILKLKKDVNRVFQAIKVIAGDKWPEVRKSLMEDNLP